MVHPGLSTFYTHPPLRRAGILPGADALPGFPSRAGRSHPAPLCSQGAQCSLTVSASHSLLSAATEPQNPSTSHTRKPSRGERSGRDSVTCSQTGDMEALSLVPPGSLESQESSRAPAHRVSQSCSPSRVKSARSWSICGIRSPVQGVGH